MPKDTLYIIGNGFDIYHGVSSRYSDFKKYLSNIDTNILDLVEEYIPVHEDWSDLESALAQIDVDIIIQNASQFLMSYSDEDWSDAGHHDYQYEINEIIEGLSEQLKSRFCEWIRQLVTPSTSEIVVRPLSLPVTARYLNFNYTSSLTDIYSIPINNIIYIHGNAQRGDNLVLGHAWNPIEIPSLNDVPEPDSMDTRVMEGNEIINKYFGLTFKNSGKIIEDNSDFYKSLSGLTKIIVLGHSLSKVDEPYFTEIVKNICVDKIQWHVSYFRDEEKEHHSAALKKIGVPDSALKLYQMLAL